MRAFLPLLSLAVLVTAGPAIAQDNPSQVEGTSFEGVVPQDFSLEQVHIVRLQPVKIEYVHAPRQVGYDSQRMQWSTTEQPYITFDLGEAVVMYGLVEAKAFPLAVGRWQRASPYALKEKTVVGLLISMDLDVIRRR